MLPYPVLTLFLLVMWLLLNGFTLGHLVLGTFVAVTSSWAMATLRLDKPKLRKWYLPPKLFAIVMIDILRSNIAVCVVILRGRPQGHRPAFITIPLELKDSNDLIVRRKFFRTVEVG
ncbi:Na+/H+ antiporter subunit E [Agrobacterium tumefaciens]|nr:Na+/H+ antiporter subunit E [Agrobacterium tumefaciens]